MGIEKIMFATTLAAALAILAPDPAVLISSTQTTPYVATPAYQGRVLTESDAALFREGLAAARARDVITTQTIMARITDPTARKLVEWALIDTSAEQLSFSELALAQSRFAAWPRADSREAAGERALDLANAGPDTVLAFFDGQAPTSVQGVIALAGALEQKGRGDEARPLIRNWWRTQSFDAAPQGRILARWSRWLTQADHETRLDMLLLGPHGPATREMITLVSPERRAVAEAVLALRTAYNGETIVAGLSPAQARDPAVVLERVRLLRAAGRQSEGFALLSALPQAPSHSDGQSTLWSERRNYFLDALERREWRAAYDSMAGHGFPSGERMVDAEFFAGWVALTRLNDPVRAAGHFEALRQMSSTPITQGRALYWLGRAAEAAGDSATAQRHYRAGAEHIQTFYG